MWLWLVAVINIGIVTLFKAETSLRCYGCANSLVILSSADISFLLVDYRFNTTSTANIQNV